MNKTKAKLRIGLIGYGGMGRGTARALHADEHWELAAIADLSETARDQAASLYPEARIIADGFEVIHDPDLDVVALTTQAGIRPAMLKAAIQAGKHVWAEKPLGSTIQEEQALLEMIEASGLHVAVNLFNRNAWYHDWIQTAIADGKIGQLVSISVRHQTPGLLPGTSHQAEGPPFHDCGMHYVDVARWYAGSEFGAFQASGIGLWGHEAPWHVVAHGHFKNGILFNITQGFIFGHYASDLTYSCGLELIGDRGVVMMSHDFQTVNIALHGPGGTEKQTGPYGDKKLDVMARKLALAISGKPVSYPVARDSVVASQVSWAMLDQAQQGCHVFGTHEDLDAVIAHQKKHRLKY